MVGTGVLLECLADERVTAVTAIGRSPSGRTHRLLYHPDAGVSGDTYAVSRDCYDDVRGGASNDPAGARSLHETHRHHPGYQPLGERDL